MKKQIDEALLIAKQVELGEAITAKLFEKRWTVTRLSKESGIVRSVLYRVFDGKKVHFTTILAVCQALELDVIIHEPINLT
jgi:DNA-binding Xre family transcriptional regulator